MCQLLLSTKLWTEWQRAGTNRYVCNATVWLLGLELRIRLGKNLTNYGPIPSLPTNHPNLSPAHEPKEDTREKLDVLLIVDGSGSVEPKNFNKMREFCKKVADSLRVSPNLVHMGIIQFATKARVEVGLTGDKNQVKMTAAKMSYMQQGTDFNVALQTASSEFGQRGRDNVRKLIIFQTDGEYNGKTIASTLHKQGIKICAVGVGNASNMTQGLQKVASQPYHDWILQVDDYDKITTILDSLVQKCSAL